MKTKNQDVKLRREYAYPKAFKAARIIRDGTVRKIKDLYQKNNRTIEDDADIHFYKLHLSDLDYKIDILEIMYRSLFNDDYENWTFGVEGSKSVAFNDVITGVLTNTFNWYKLVPFKDNVDYLGSIYMLLFGDNVDTPNNVDLVIQSQIEFLYKEIQELERLKSKGSIKPSEYDTKFNEIKTRLMTFIVVFNGHISIEDLFKSFDFTPEEFLKIIRTYSIYGKYFDWHDYFIGRYYAENTNGPLFDLEAISVYLKDDSSIKEKEEFVDHLIEFVERLDKREQLNIDEAYLYNNDKYILNVLDAIMTTIQEDREL